MTYGTPNAILFPGDAAAFLRFPSVFMQPKESNKILRKRVKIYMKKMSAIAAAALLSLYAGGSADAEGPLHWTARHVGQAAVETGDTLSNVARTAGRTIHHRTKPIRQVFR
jgi:hypothetical protein